MQDLHGMSGEVCTELGRAGYSGREGSLWEGAMGGGEEPLQAS